MKASYPVAYLCRFFEVSRSRYYASLLPPATHLADRAALLERATLTAFADSAGVAGYRKVTAALHRAGIPVNRKTVNRIMTRHGLVSMQAHRHRYVSRRRARRGPDPVDRLSRDFSSDRAGQILVGDITYVRTKQGWLYVAVVIDLASRAVIGRAMGARQTSQLCVRALKNACQSGLVRPGTILHSDHGRQYTAKRFAQECNRLGVVRSMGAKMQCWDNAAAETFFSKLKGERLDWVSFLTRDAARAEVHRYVNRFNQTRTHAALGYVTPCERLEALALAV